MLECASVDTNPDLALDSEPLAEKPHSKSRASFRMPSMRFVPALFFAYIGLVLLIFTFYVPPFQKSDELAHFYRAVSLTNLDLVCKTDAQGQRYYPMKQKYAAVESVFHVWDVALQYNKKFDRNWLDARFTDPSYQQEVKVDGPCDFSPLGYAPSAFGVLLGKPFESPLASLYLGRLCGALFFVAGMILALRVIPPRFQSLIYLYGALPSVLHQVSTISYDAVHLALLPPLFAYFMRFVVAEKPIARRELAIFMVLLVWIVNVRLVAFTPLLLLFFVIKPALVEPNRRRYLAITAGLFVTAGLLTLALSLVYYPKNLVYLPDQTYDSFKQLSYILRGPWRFPEAAYNTLRLHLEQLLGQGVSGFGWQDYGLDYFSYYLIIISATTILVVTTMREGLLIGRLQLLALSGAIVGTGLALFLAAYLFWSPVGTDSVDGLQGRYFLVLLPPFIFGISQLAAWMGRERLVHLLLFAGAVILLRNVYRAVDLRYFG